MPSSVVWFEIYVTDIERAMAFYGQLAGWQFAELDGMPADTYRQVTNTPDGTVGGALVAGHPERCGHSGAILYLHVVDIDHSVEQALGAGGSLDSAKQEINPSAGRFTLIRDPDGNLVGLWSP